MASAIPPIAPGQSTGLSPWRRLGDLTLLVPQPYNFGNFLYQRVPGFMRDNDLLFVDGSAQQQQVSNTPPLARFFQLLGFQLDQVRAFADSLLQVNDPLNCSGVLLYQLSQQFGMPYDIEMGMAQVRNLVYNAVALYQSKGTLPGISGFASTFTGWPTTTTVGTNRLPTTDDGLFFASTGTWTFSANVSTAPWSVSGFSPPNYNNSGVTTPIPNGLKVTVNTSGTFTMTGAQLPAVDFLSDAGVGNVTLSVWAYLSAGRTVVLDLSDESGTLLNTSSTAVSATTGTTVTLSTSVNLATDTAFPKWLIPVLTISATSGDVYYLTALAAYNTSTAPSLYDPPRDLKIVLGPQAGNLLGNPLTWGPSFPYGIDGWVTTAGSDNFIAAPAPAGITLPDGTLLLQISPVAGAFELHGGIIQTLTTRSIPYSYNPSNFEAMPVVPDADYTFSVYVAAQSSTVGKSFNLGISFLLSNGQTQTSVSTFTVTGNLARYSITAPAPLTAVSAFAVISATGLTSTDLFYANSAMVVEAAAPGPYFDVWTVGVDPDYRLGTNGQSLYYENIGVKLPRLEAVLPSWVPANSTYTVTLALNATVPGAGGGGGPSSGATFPLTLPTTI